MIRAVSINCSENSCNRCTGCAHNCHHRPPTRDLRAIYRQRRNEIRAAEGRPLLPDLDDSPEEATTT